MARSFNGSTNLITADGANIYTGTASPAAYSVSLWVKDALTANVAFYSEGNGNDLSCLLLASDLSTGAKLRYFLRDASATVTDISTTATVLDGSWHHCCATRDTSKNLVLYVDGAQDTTHTDGAMTVVQTRVSFGVLRRTTNGNFFNGTLAEIATWARVLSAAEVKGLAAGLPASHLGPKHYWPLWGRDSPEPDIGNG